MYVCCTKMWTELFRRPHFPHFRSNSESQRLLRATVMMSELGTSSGKKDKIRRDKMPFTRASLLQITTARSHAVCVARGCMGNSCVAHAGAPGRSTGPRHDDLRPRSGQVATQPQGIHQMVSVLMSGRAVCRSFVHICRRARRPQSCYLPS